ncbi:MAG TPA: siphovirus Gp157 family protein [Gemmataceae bacterium]|nr:siphovirus Gp157 family protein [Gemmataceae bacterium]
MKLYEISEELRMVGMRLAEGIDDDGEIPAEVSDELDALTVAMEQKLDGCCALHAEMAAESAAFKREADRLARLAGAAARRADWLKSYMHRCMVAAGMKSVDAGRFRVRIQNNGRPSIRLADGVPIPEGIPEAYRRVTIEFDSQAAYEAWKNNLTLPDSIRVERGTHLRIS